MQREQSHGEKRERGWEWMVWTLTTLKRMRLIVVLERELTVRVHRAVHHRGGVTPRRRWTLMIEIFDNTVQSHRACISHSFARALRMQSGMSEDWPDH
eukprot:8459003-Karenia_brevis.AAC.1